VRLPDYVALVVALAVAFWVLFKAAYYSSFSFCCCLIWKSYEALHWLTQRLTQASFFSAISDLHFSLQVAMHKVKSAVESVEVEGVEEVTVPGGTGGEFGSMMGDWSICGVVAKISLFFLLGKLYRTYPNSVCSQLQVSKHPLVG